MPKKRITPTKRNNNKNFHHKIEVDIKSFKKMFNKAIINKIARESGFIKRIRKVNAFDFFLSVTFGALKGSSVTASAIVEDLSEKITRASVNERFTEDACKFFQEVYAHFFKILNATKKNINVDLFKKFNEINIIDSSSWKLPQALKDAFAGFNKDGCKIQLMLNYKTGTISLFDLTKETYNDKSYSKDISKNISKNINANDLYIFDLGYLVVNAIINIHKGLAFFSRFNPKCIVLYIKKGSQFHKVDILNIVKVFSSSKHITEFEYYVGSESEKIKIRLFVVKVPEEVANQRRRKLRKATKREGYMPSKRALTLCDWSFFMTNIPVQKNIDVKELLALYPLRWSIELYFKQLKSVLQVHKTEVKSNPHRLQCEILGKAIVALFISFCYSTTRAHTWNNFNEEISFEKTVKYFKRHVSIFIDQLRRSMRKAVDCLQKMIINICNNCRKYRQKTRQNSLDVLIQRSIYNNLGHKKINKDKLVGLIP